MEESKGKIFQVDKTMTLMHKNGYEETLLRKNSNKEILDNLSHANKSTWSNDIRSSLQPSLMLQRPHIDIQSQNKPLKANQEPHANDDNEKGINQEV